MDDERWAMLIHPDYVAGDSGPLGHGSGTDDERDDVILYDRHGRPAVTARYRRKIGFDWRT